MVEWIIVLAIVAILFFIGPKKIPALARSLGRTFGEFRRGREEGEREFNEAARPAGQPRSTDETRESEAPDPPHSRVATRGSGAERAGNGESDVTRAARNLGIPTEGKNEEELKREIADRVKSAGS